MTDVISAISKAINDAGGVRKLAAELGFSPTYISAVKRGAPASKRLRNILGIKSDEQKIIEHLTRQLADAEAQIKQLTEARDNAIKAGQAAR